MTKREKLLEYVLEEIKRDVKNGDVTAIEDLLEEVSNESLFDYLPDEIQKMITQDDMINQGE
jgi:hypothetical protein